MRSEFVGYAQTIEFIARARRTSISVIKVVYAYSHGQKFASRDDSGNLRRFPLAIAGLMLICGFYNKAEYGFTFVLRQYVLKAIRPREGGWPAKLSGGDIDDTFCEDATFMHDRSVVG